MAKKRAKVVVRETGISPQRLIELAIQGLRSSAEAIQHEIADLEHRMMDMSLDVVKGVADGTEAMLSGPKPRKRRRSSAARARVASAEKPRRAKRQASTGSKKTAKRKRHAKASSGKPRKMSATARKAASERMKAYWAKRKAS